MKSYTFKCFFIFFLIGCCFEIKAQQLHNGTWKNKQVTPNALSKLKIDKKNSQFQAHIWLSCMPDDCDLGEQPLIVVGKEKANGGIWIENSQWEKKITIKLLTPKSELECIVETNYKDGRKKETEYFILQKIAG